MTTAGSAAELIRDHQWLPSYQMGRLATESPVVLERGEGARVWDADGRCYIDAFGGLAVVNVGYGREEIVEAVAEQLRRLHFVNQFELVHEGVARLAERLSALTPWDEGARSFFVTGGSEAVEAALKIAKAYHRRLGAPGRYKLIGRHYAYHGVTMGALSVQGIPASRAPYEPLVPGARHVGHSIEELERVVEFEGPETIAAMIFEPVQNVGGALVPSDDYFRQVTELCRAHGILFIMDSVVCSVGRTGTWLGFETWDCAPDLVTVSKGLTSGYQALGAVIARHEVANVFIGEEERKLDHGHTFGGLPASCAAALVALDITEREGLLEASVEKGELLKAALRESLADSPILGEVRGVGLFGAVEFVGNRETGAKFPCPELFSRHGPAAAALREHGVIARVDNRLNTVVQWAPPLVVDSSGLDQMVTGITAAAAWVERELLERGEL
ncbi:MAG TPA: aspartate aminotransferase family protein [Thermoleophilaceae bacterium]|nr:aspartate aminotransferase family protein [Thermoleophilaceae bacterium]